MDSPWCWYCVNENEVKGTSASLPSPGSVTAVLVVEIWELKSIVGSSCSKKGEFKTCMGSMRRVSGADKQTSDSVDGGGGAGIHFQPCHVAFRVLLCCLEKVLLCTFHSHLGAGETALIRGWKNSLGNYTCCCKAFAVGCGRLWHWLHDQPAWCCCCKER